MVQRDLVPTPGQTGHCQMCGKDGVAFQVMANRAFFLCSNNCGNNYGNQRAQAIQLSDVNATIDTTGHGIGDYVREQRQRAYDSKSFCWFCGNTKKMGDDYCPGCGVRADVPMS